MATGRHGKRPQMFNLDNANVVHRPFLSCVSVNKLLVCHQMPFSVLFLLFDTLCYHKSKTYRCIRMHLNDSSFSQIANFCHFFGRNQPAMILPKCVVVFFWGGANSSMIWHDVLSLMRPRQNENSKPLDACPPPPHSRPKMIKERWHPGFSEDYVHQGALARKT